MTIDQKSAGNYKQTPSIICEHLEVKVIYTSAAPTAEI